MLAAASVNRRDVWPSRQAAADKMRTNPAFKAWDPRVLDKCIEYGLRELPTELYPDPPSPAERGIVPVTLQTTKSQEQYNYIKPIYDDDRLLMEPGHAWTELPPEDRADVGEDKFYRPETIILWNRLPELKPSILYVCGSKSALSVPEISKPRSERTGTGAGGSGGMAKGRVKEAMVDGGHLVPYEKPREVALVSAGFLDEELGRWQGEETERRRKWEALSRRERLDVDDKWREGLRVSMKKEGARKTSPPPEKL